MASSVAISRCAAYDLSRITTSLDKLIDQLGGIDCFVSSGQKVLVKPNMLSAKSPDAAVTTHPVLLEAVILLVQQSGGIVSIGDSPSAVYKGLKRYWENTGYREVAERTGVRLLNFEAGGTLRQEINGRVYHIARDVMEADVVINLPKMKTHGLTLYTGAVKNVYGCVPGFQKALYHKQFPHPDDFSEILLDVFACVQPALTIMDAICAMEGNGPSTGTPRDVGLLLASDNGVSLDAVANFIMGYGDDEVATTHLAGKRGLGETRMSKIEIFGETLEAVRIKNYVLPSNHVLFYLPKWLLRWLGRFLWVKPRTDLSRCTGCSVCAEACPVDAIKMEKGIPITDYGTCINCLCCNESCPESAVYQEYSSLARLFS